MMRVAIIVLLFVNACYYIDKQKMARKYAINSIEHTELKLSDAGYLLLNIVCAGLMIIS